MDHTSSFYRQVEKKLESPGGTLDLRLRSLVLSAAAAASGRRDRMRVVLKISLEHNTSKTLLYEALLQTYLFAGYPRAINALAELAILAPAPSAPEDLDLDRDLVAGADWLARGETLCRTVYGPSYDRLLEVMARVSPELGRWMVVEGYGKVLSRPQLDPAVRELSAVAALSVLHVPDQLRAHLRGSLLVGGTEEQLKEVLSLAGLLDPEAEQTGLRLLSRVAEDQRRALTG